MNQTASQYAPGIELKREAVTAADLVKAGVDLARDFPGASLSEFKRYPVLSEGGWYMVIKHLPTLRSVSRVPWNLLGPVPLTSNGLVLD
jgi:hypothetical protein